MSNWMENLKAKDKIDIFDAFMYIKRKHVQNPDIKLPSMELILSNGKSYTGTILDCNYAKSRLAFLSSIEPKRTAVSFISFDSIITVTLFDLDLCNEFVERFSKD